MTTLFLLLRDDLIPETRVDLEATSTEVLGVFTHKEGAELARAETRAALVAGRVKEHSEFPGEFTTEEIADEIDAETTFRIQEHNIDPNTIDTEFGPVQWIDAARNTNAIVNTTA